MKRTEFEQLVEQVLTTLPDEYAGRLHNLVFIVEEWAGAELLHELGFMRPKNCSVFSAARRLASGALTRLISAPS